MPADLTIFAAKYLVFVTVVPTAAILAVRLWSRPRVWVLRWTLAAGLLLVLSYALAQLGSAVYNDPRPFITSHVPPLIPHAPDNGFPSDHALLAAALVAVVALVDVWWALPIAVLAVLVDWGRVGSGLHHVVDVVGSSVLVALATLVAFGIARLAVRWLAPHLPTNWNEQPLVPMRKRP
ncbi:MAG: phosphatase PAP2 family protein [Dehalococcoidia bacterium]